MKKLLPLLLILVFFSLSLGRVNTVFAAPLPKPTITLPTGTDPTLTCFPDNSLKTTISWPKSSTVTSIEISSDDPVVASSLVYSEAITSTTSTSDPPSIDLKGFTVKSAPASGSVKATEAITSLPPSTTFSVYLYSGASLVGKGTFSSSVACTTSAAAAATDGTTVADGTWAPDAEVTKYGMLAARSVDFLNWSLKNYQWFYSSQDPAAAGLPNPLELAWKKISSIVYALLSLGILVSAFVLLIGQGRDIRLFKFLVRFALVVLLVTFSYAIVYFLYQIGDILQSFFLAPGGVPMTASDLFGIAWSYTGFEGYKIAGDAYAESAFMSLLLVKLTTFTYFLISILMIVRKVIMWFFIILSPIFALLVLWKGVRGVAKVWAREFFRWLLYGPLFTIFLATLVIVWKAYIPQNLSLVCGNTPDPSKNIYPTSISILLGGPCQVASLDNNLNTPDAYIQYVIALIMLWAAIVVPFLLLRMILGYVSNYFASDSYAAQNLLVKNFLSERLMNKTSHGDRPPNPSGSPSGLARALPKSLTSLGGLSVWRDRPEAQPPEREESHLGTVPGQQNSIFSPNSSSLPTQNDRGSSISPINIPRPDHLGNIISQPAISQSSPLFIPQPTSTQTPAVDSRSARTVVPQFTAGSPSRSSGTTTLTAEPSQVFNQQSATTLNQNSLSSSIPALNSRPAHVNKDTSISAGSIAAQPTELFSQNPAATQNQAGQASSNSTSTTNINSEQQSSGVTQSTQVTNQNSSLTQEQTNRTSSVSAVNARQTSQFKPGTQSAGIMAPVGSTIPASSSAPLVGAVSATPQVTVFIVPTAYGELKNLKIDSVSAQQISSEILNLANLTVPTMKEISSYETSILSQNPNNPEQDKFTRVSEALNRLAGTSPLLTTEEKQSYQKVAQHISEVAEQQHNPVAKSISQTLIPVSNVAIPKVNSVQKVNLEDYEDVKKNCKEFYQKADVPTELKGKYKDKQQWLKDEIKNIDTMVADLSSTDPLKKQQANKNLSKILPFLLLGGFSEAEIISYLQAKKQSAKEVLEQTDKKVKDDKEQDELLDADKKPVEQPKQQSAEMTMDVPDDKLIPIQPTTGQPAQATNIKEEPAKSS